MTSVSLVLMGGQVVSEVSAVAQHAVSASGKAGSWHLAAKGPLPTAYSLVAQSAKDSLERPVIRAGYKESKEEVPATDVPLQHMGENYRRLNQWSQRQKKLTHERNTYRSSS